MKELLDYPYPENLGVIIASEETVDFYEGAYLNTINYNPSKINILSTIGLWIINNGYLWEVHKIFKKKSTLVELGCASGVKYFGSNYHMIGVDVSLTSLKRLTNYYDLCIKADIIHKIPLKDNSVDGIISSFFWEHISLDDKYKILKECYRILKPGGKILFLYDVDNENFLIRMLKKKDYSLYETLFIKKDGHIGYHSIQSNLAVFNQSYFSVLKHQGKEKTMVQSPSVYVKLSEVKGYLGIIGKIGNKISGRKLYYFYLLVYRFIDTSFGKFLSDKKARIVLTVAEKKIDE